MSSQNQTLETIQDIRNMMDRSSRFISLSGLSGIAAGLCALTGAWFAYDVIETSGGSAVRKAGLISDSYSHDGMGMLRSFMGHRLFTIAMLTLVFAIVLAVFFTYLRSKKQGVPVWGASARRLVWNVALPVAAGGLFLLKLIEAGVFGLIAPGCLIFYGLALVNGAKYTIGEIRFLGYAMIALGLINCWFPGYGLYFWATGFGLLHIIYGIMMWSKYERQPMQMEKKV
ncbi:MAG: hypothetical protein KA160_01445 [Lacibacter sp.]|jgi:hypothetical protein|nr:hypothetical protein [Lacibacter sp.]